MKWLFIVLINLIFQLSTQAQTQILVIGTMHDQPEGFPDNYKPILEIVKEWNPQVICTEYMLPTDTTSILKSYGNDYFAEIDSIRISWNMDVKDANHQIQDLYMELANKNDLHNRMRLRNLLYLTHDIGNARFQAYQVIQALDKKSKSEREDFTRKYPMYEDMLDYELSSNNDEFTRLEFPLALEKNIKYLYPTDDQSLRDLYHEAWEKAHEELKDSTILVEFESFVNDTKSKMGEYAQAGSTLLMLNSRKYQEILYKLEYAFMPVGLNAQKDLMNYYYMDRNFKMAQHILNVAKLHPGKKIAVFYGVSHVPFINKILRSESNHRILTLPDLE